MNSNHFSTYPKRLKKMRMHGEDVEVLDGRSLAELRVRHVVGAKYRPVDELSSTRVEMRGRPKRRKLQATLLQSKPI